MGGKKSLRNGGNAERASWACARGESDVSQLGPSAGKNSRANGRVEALLDVGSPFLELSSLAAHEVYPDALPGAGLVTGIGMSRLYLTLTGRNGGR